MEDLSQLNIQERISRLLELFKDCADWEERYQVLINLGKESPALTSEEKLEKFRVKGCQSAVWLVPEQREAKLFFKTDSDSVLVKGIASLLVFAYSGSTPAEILAAKTDFLKEIGITEHLSMNRTNGLAAMARQIQMYAVALNSLKQ